MKHQVPQFRFLCGVEAATLGKVLMPGVQICYDPVEVRFTFHIFYLFTHALSTGIRRLGPG
jgi:hypothetical protein